MSVLPLRLGLRGEIGLLVAGSRRGDFPRQTERLLLSVAANQATVGLQGARHLSEQKRLAGELDQCVAQRTAELAASNEELRREISERQRAEETLRLSERNLRRLTESIPQMLWSATPDGYVNRAVPDEELDAFVDALAERIASFDRQAIAATKRLVDVASRPPASEIAPEWDAFIASLGRPAAKSRIGMLMERGFHKPGDVERRLGYHVGQLGG